MAVDDALLGSERTRAAIEKYCAVTGVTVQLYGADGVRVFGPVHRTPLFDLFSGGGDDARVVAECLDQVRSGQPDPVVVDRFGLAAVGTSLRLDGEAVCVAVAGPVLIAHVSHRETQQLASDNDRSFDAVWFAARKELPLPRQRLALYGELLQVVGETLVTEHRRSQEAEAARGEAESANRLKDEFLAVVSHELRNPLNAILGWSRLLGGGQVAAARTADAIRTIERNAKALARIIDDILDLSRIIGGGVRIEPGSVDLVAVIEGALDEMDPAARARGVEVTFRSATPDPVGGDSIRLQQAVANLVSNAIKFTPSGGRVDVALTQVGAEAEIRVTDTGQGIEAAFLPRIFDRFSQADASTTRRQGGLGLGLAIVRALVERHGGSVRAESAGPGQGATFTMRLPVLAPDAAAEIEAGNGPGASAAAWMRLDGVRVLLVEDDADGRQVLTLVLELAGATVVPAASVRAALDALAAARPDVIVTDIGMPDEDGVTLLGRVRAGEAKDGHRIPAIALTGYASPEDRARLLAAGFQRHLRKPVEPDEIIAAVASLREGWSSNDAADG